ncbi:MAG: glycerophosphodiester phosphodiesterase family protein, partial [Bacteroidetes bacterium]|nr:glycerophosphodiester phosphodiesterase family protein [Bacteroidota bacterium]
AVKKIKQGNLHRLNYSEIKKYDCGKRGNKKFPQQTKIAEYKPLLTEVIECMELFCKENNLAPIHYNIEIKSNPLGDGKYHFEPTTTTSIVYNVIKKYSINDRILIQSFDVRSLKAIHQLNDQLKIGLLVANFRSVNFNIKKLGFTPNYYNPALKICKKNTITQAHHFGCKIIVWTVDSEKEIKQIIRMGADGIITDYPNIANKMR